MKSKTVASILRHVASKINTMGPDAQLDDAQAIETGEKESRKARKARQEDEVPEQLDGPPAGANEEEKLEKLYEQIAWPLGKKYGHPYDAFKLALTLLFLSPVVAQTH